MAVHGGSGSELGPDGHLVVPVDAALVRDAAARKTGVRL
jgi:hypothetical protein